MDLRDGEGAPLRASYFSILLFFVFHGLLSLDRRVGSHSIRCKATGEAIAAGGINYRGQWYRVRGPYNIFKEFYQFNCPLLLALAFGVMHREAMLMAG